MDFSKFDNRAPAEEGVRVPLVDPVTKEPIEGEDGPACVIVRGTASRTVQAALRRRALAKAKDTTQHLDVMEDVHRDLIETAMPLIAGFENVERNGRALTTSDEDVRWFLDLTFPQMEKSTRAERLETGQEWKMVNQPFAKQIAEAAGDQNRFLPSAAQD